MKVLLISVGAEICFIRNTNLIVAYSISPVISNGLSFGVINGTITISGTPIVASDPVTYVVTANGFFSNDTATVDK
jgi:hypothetical protein